MKTIERITIGEKDLQPSRTLSAIGTLVFINPEDENEELALLGLTSNVSNSEKEAMDSLRERQQIITEAMPGTKIYVIDGETKVWNEKGDYVAYELSVYPGITLDEIRKILPKTNRATI
jgi:hypothetical protein